MQTPKREARVLAHGLRAVKTFTHYLHFCTCCAFILLAVAFEVDLPAGIILLGSRQDAPCGNPATARGLWCISLAAAFLLFQGLLDAAMQTQAAVLRREVLLDSERQCTVSRTRRLLRIHVSARLFITAACLAPKAVLTAQLVRLDTTHWLFGVDAIGIAVACLAGLGAAAFARTQLTKNRPFVPAEKAADSAEAQFVAPGFRMDGEYTQSSVQFVAECW